MYISRNWLADWVDFDDLAAEDFSELITTRVAEVDEMHLAASPLAGALVARILEVKEHPEKKKLKIALAAIGKEQVEVVCGAANCRPDMLTAYVPPGKSLFAGGGELLQLVETREVAGVSSQGVFASEAELGLSASHDGILEITADLVAEARRSNSAPASTNTGDALSSLFGEPDVLLEIDNKSLTHRPDLWSHYGFARELGAILGRPLTLNADSWADDTDKGAELLRSLGEGKTEFRVKIESGSGCRRFTALEIRNVSAKPSPLWLRRRLFSIGAGVRNVPVDLSNYVMHDIGQPNHTYDADLLKGSVIGVRNAKQDEVFDGLDGESRTLSTEDIVITDERGCIALGGVMGGGPTAVSEGSTRLLLEAANFDPDRIRSTCKRHQLRTDASNRFEKSLSAFGVPLAPQRYAQLICELDSSVSILGGIGDDFPEKPASVQVPFSFSYIRERLGKEIEDAELSRILTSLGFRLEDKGTSSTSDVPYYRATRDINIQDDLVEEVGRIHGYENIPEAAPRIESTAAKSRPIAELENALQDCLCGLGFSEVYNYSFMNGAQAEALGCSTKAAVEVKNPVDANKRLIRTTLIPGMLEVVERNARYQPSMLLYELGRIYRTESDPRLDALPFVSALKNPAAFESRALCLAYSSGTKEKALSSRTQPPVKSGGDFYALLSALRRLCRLVGSQVPTTKPLETPAAWMHPHRAAALFLGSEQIGTIAEVHPAELKECKNRVVISQLSVELLLAAAEEAPQFKPLPKYPDSLFEMSIVAPKRTPYAEIETLLTENTPEGLLRRIEVVAVYEGAPLAETEKSISVKLHLGSDDHTLSGEELQTAQDSLMNAVESSSFDLRS